MSNSNNITIELTRKDLKVHKLISVIIMFVSLTVVLCSEDQGNAATGVLCFMGGSIYWLITKIRIWWNHS